MPSPEILARAVASETDWYQLKGEPTDFTDFDRLRYHIVLALRAERERAAQVAEAATREPMDYIGWSPGLAADDRSRYIAARIRALD